ncbi:hypothetical protein F4804DRAFT_304601 [Jackrogersella minutella]|nr:hypothetical protein F4804DRAFT_304601 [Jackrogersella minutella]
MWSFLLLSVAALQLILPTRGDDGRLDVQSVAKRPEDRSATRSGSLAESRRARGYSLMKHDAKASIAGVGPCTEGFEKPKYQFSDFQFNKTTIKGGDRGMAHFQLIDIVNNESTSCTTPYLQDTNSPVWNECDGYNDAVSPKTTFKFTASTSELEVSQMWICEAENKTHPHSYFSSAKIELSELLQCADDAKQTICTVADDAVSPLSSEYVTPVWNSGSVEIIPPSENAVPETPWNPTPCIGPSFSYPNWDVQDFLYERGDNGSSASFRLDNHASNQSVACTIQEGEWSSCDNSTNVRFIREIGELSVNQTWTCNGDEDYPENVIFRAVGSVTIESDSASSIYMKGSLTEPVELTPNVAPEGVNYPGCLETSETPSWIVTSWVWNEMWRNGYNSGELTVTFYNPATGFNLTCSGDGEELNRDGRYGLERWWGCDFASSPFSDYRTVSLIKLNPLTAVFSIDQRWYCNGHDDKLPAKFKAVGDVDTTLDCSWNNDTSTNSSIKTCYQTELPWTVEGNVMEKTELDQNIFFEMPPSGYSCTIASVLATQWKTSWMSNSLFVNPTFADTFKTKGRFSITFVALDGYQGVSYENTSLTPFLPTSEPGRWYDCKNYETGEETSDVWARNSIDCKWQLDLATGYFAINHTWFCDDKNPDNPIVFKGSGSRFYDFSCYIDRSEDMISCDPTGLNPPPVLPTYLSWKSMSVGELRA